MSHAQRPAGQAGQPRNRWTVVAAYCAVSSANQMLWLTFAPITTVAASHCRVSVSAMGWMAEVFPLVYVVLALPAGALLDRWFRGWLGIGGVLTATGALSGLAAATTGYSPGNSSLRSPSPSSSMR